MVETKLFKGFEKETKEKYGYMADDMLCFFDDFVDFFDNEKIKPSEFNEAHYDYLFETYLDYMGLSDAEFSMAFQILINFCDYCTAKDIDMSIFKDYLIKEKENLYEYWIDEGDDEVIDTIPEGFDDINPHEILENFDSYYEVMKLSLKNKQMDNKQIQKNLENIYDFLHTGFTISTILRKEKPTISEEELQEEVGKKIDEKGIQFILPDDTWVDMFSLPKKQSKKFMEFMILLDENFDHEPGTKERNDSMEQTLSCLKSLIKDIKTIKTTEK
jgi:hypothetical protein